MNGLLGERLSATEIAQIVFDAGLSDWHGINAVAIALAESGGFVWAVNVVVNPESQAHLSLDLGLWQVNSFWHPTLEISDTLVPEVQIQYVLELAKKVDSWGYNWNWWTTWRNGSARRMIGTARHAMNDVREANGLAAI